MTIMSDLAIKSREHLVDERNTPITINFRDEHIWVTFADGRVLGVPLDWYPELRNASEAERSNYVATPLSIRWRELRLMIDIPSALHATYGT
jgi:hypothetical protein